MKTMSTGQCLTRGQFQSTERHEQHASIWYAEPSLCQSKGWVQYECESSSLVFTAAIISRVVPVSKR